MGLFIDTGDSVARPRSVGFREYPNNSLMGYMQRGADSGVLITSEAQLQLPAGTYVLPAAYITGCVLVINQWGFITNVTTLTNCTGVYTDAYDGTVAKPLNKVTGIDLSGATVGSYLSTTGDPTQDATLLDASEVEVLFADRKNPINPFLVNSKYGVTTELRLHMTTTDNPIDFNLKMNFVYQLMSDNASFSLA